MKKYKILKSLIAMITLGFIAFSCLNDPYNDFSAVAPTAEMLGVQAGRSIAFDLSGNSVDSILVKVNVTGPNAPSTDVTLSLGVSQAFIDLYNRDTLHVPGTLLPESSNAYSFPSTVTIKAGKDELSNNNRTASFWLVLTEANIPSTPGVNYVIPVAITGAPSGYVISSNQGAILYNFYHNPYDGDYTSNGNRYNFTKASDYAGWDFTTNAPKASSTIASISPWGFASTAAITVNAQNTSVHEGNDKAAFGTINLKVNADNTVTISSNCPANDGTCPLPATGVANLFPLAGGPKSTWNPATKTFDLYYQYTNAPVAPATEGTFRVLHDVMVHN